MAAGGSVKVVFGAVAANLLIAISKFIVASISGSAAMMAEGIHSFVDTSNGLLLFLGMKKSKSGPSEKHPYGTGMELYFWSFVVSMMVFVLGGAFAIYEGIHHLHSKGHEGSYLYNYLVFGIAFLLEGYSLVYSVRIFKKQNKGVGMVSAIRDSKDAPTIAVILEEFGAVIGIIIATLGTFLTQMTGIAMIDGITSIVIGVLLLCISWILATETKRLLIGEGMSRSQVQGITSILEGHKVIDNVLEVKTMHLSIDSVVLNATVDVNDDMKVGDWEQENQQIEAELKKAYPMLEFVYLDVNNVK